MLYSSGSQIERRLNSLEKHLKQENPVLLQVVQSFRDLDKVAYRMGVLDREESFATRVPWWPMISILGTFSSGKSTFINEFIGQKLQRTGNQAVDDKFTVICFSKEEKSHTLPGIALDADPRFPFYQISRDIEKVSEGEGRRIDAYLQMKTTGSERLRGKIIIDSPGFDADAQRTSTLRITDHIMDLSDLVLVFFDARHPEPGAMKDTLNHLVSHTIHRPDSNKFLFILNQVDCTVQEDNLEDVVASWQRALAQSGLTAGRFYEVYSKEAAYPILEEELRLRYEAKRNEDMAEITQRIQRVEVERAYRIIGVLENTARTLQEVVVPTLRDLIQKWRKKVLVMDAILFGVIAFGLTLAYLTGVTWPGPVLEGVTLDEGGMPQGFTLSHLASYLAILSSVVLVGFVHFQFRTLARRFVLWRLRRQTPDPLLHEYLEKGLTACTRPTRSLFRNEPAGWGNWAQRRISQVLTETDMYIQNLNDQFTNPSGKPGGKNPKVALSVE